MILPRGRLAALFGDAESRRAALAAHPGWRNILRTEADLAEYGDEYDVLNAASSFHKTSLASKKIYDAFFDEVLCSVPADARVLEAGCGVGRFTLDLAARFSRVTAVDGSPAVLERNYRHLSECGLAGRVSLVCADPGEPVVSEDNAYDLVFAVEYIGYADDPAAALANLVRAARPGAPVCVTAEGVWGSLPADSQLRETDLALRLESARRHDSEVAYVSYFTEVEFENLLRGTGLQDIVTRPSHYLLEGPFWNLVDESRLDEESYIAQLLKIEEACRRNPITRPLARVICGTGVK